MQNILCPSLGHLGLRHICVEHWPPCAHSCWFSYIIIQTNICFTVICQDKDSHTVRQFTLYCMVYSHLQFGYYCSYL